MRVAKTKVLISCAATAHLIFAFGLAYAGCWFFWCRGSFGMKLFSLNKDPVMLN